MVTFKALPGAFGVEITDIDLAKASDDALRDMLRVFHRHQLIVIRNQDLSFDQYDSLTKKFGMQRPHFLDHLRMRGHPAILMLSNVFEDGRQIGVFEGACFWHTDVAYEDPPNSSTIVYSIQKPEGGCPTHFCDMFSAYDALPEKTKRRIDDLMVIHHYGNRADTREGSPTAAETLTEDQKKRVANVTHPLVKRHPMTGRKALYGVAGSSFGIVGMPEDEAIGLLDELAEHALQPRFMTTYDYEPGDVAAWDTYSTLHKATLTQRAQAGDAHARVLWRVSVTGESPLFPPEEIYKGKELVH